MNRRTSSMKPELNRIDKRAIEAQAVVPVLEAVAARLGAREAAAILREINEEEARARGAALARSTGENDMHALEREVAGWGEGGVWEMTVLERTDRTYFFDVTRCPYADRYEQLGVKEHGVALSCCRDAPFAEGFNPRLRLIRTKTIMEGAAVCDFRYHLED